MTLTIEDLAAPPVLSSLEQTMRDSTDTLAASNLLLSMIAAGSDEAFELYPLLFGGVR